MKDCWTRALLTPALTLCLFLASGCGPAPSATSTPAAPATPEPSATPEANYRGLVPLAGVPAPSLDEVVRVKMSTQAGAVTLEVYPQAAPVAAERFLKLVDSGFLDQTAFFLVLRKPPIAKFGSNWRPEHKPEMEKKWSGESTGYFEIDRGTLTFAVDEEKKSSTKVILHTKDNRHMKAEGLVVFGRVVEGIDFVYQLRPAGQKGDPQMACKILEGGMDYINGLPEPERPTMITKVERL